MSDRRPDALADLTARRGLLERPPLQGLCGRFHSHVTVQIEEDRLADLRAIARTQQAKVTVIDLAAVQRDVMLTRYHVDPDPGAIGRIADDLGSTCRALAKAGLVAVRVKIEHESEPSLPRYDAERYHEVHIKLSLPEDRYEELLAWLGERAGEHGWVASRNPYERRSGRVIQFVTLRCYDGDRAGADLRVEQATAALSARGLEIGEIKRETTVLDTRQDHDRWWA